MLTSRQSKVYRWTLMILLTALFIATTPLFADQTYTADEVADFSALLSEHPDVLVQEKALDTVFSVSFYLPYAPGEKIFVTKYFSLNSVLRRPARAAIFLTGPEFNGDFWAIPVEGYNGPEMAARRGFFAYTFDYIGVRNSHVPTDGSGIDFVTQAPAVDNLIDFVRRSTRTKRVDLIGEGYGAEVASLFSADKRRVRSISMSVITYKNFAPAIAGFFTKAFEDFLRAQPDGYWTPFFLPNTLAFSPNDDLRDYVFATQEGIYPTGPALQFYNFGLPVIDAAAARVPLLIIGGEVDPFPAAGDLEELAADWGDEATLVVIPGGNHVPRIESEEIAEQYFDALFDFVDP